MTAIVVLRKSFIYNMKSLQESLFDQDLADKKLPTFGNHYKLDRIEMLWGDAYANYNGYEEDLDLINKMFKENKLKNIKPESLDGVDLEWYKNNPEIYDSFLRLLTLLNDLPDTPDCWDGSAMGRYAEYHFSPDDQQKLKSYLNHAKMHISLSKSFWSYDIKDYCPSFIIIKNFGSPKKFIGLRANYIER